MASDVRTDAERGRIYLPGSELARFEVSEEEILNLQYSERFRALAASVAERYEVARELLCARPRRGPVGGDA